MFDQQLTNLTTNSTTFGSLRDKASGLITRKTSGLLREVFDLIRDGLLALQLHVDGTPVPDAQHRTVELLLDLVDHAAHAA